ncbi:MAG: hypothetical protein Q9225_003273 [Loekoesia sp. 1 TL-2023]
MNTLQRPHEFAEVFLSPRQNAGPTLIAPPGVTPNYVDPASRGNRVIVASLTLMIITGIFVTARLMIKWRVVKRWGWDDPDAKYYKLGMHTWDINPADLYRVGEMQKNVSDHFGKTRWGFSAPRTR